MSETNSKPLLFIHTPKTGGQYLSRALRSVSSNYSKIKNATNINLIRRGIHIPYKKILEFENSNKKYQEDYDLISIVRNPFDRMYSMFEYYSKIRIRIPQDETFESFVLNFAEKYHGTKPAFSTCYDFLKDDKGELPLEKLTILRFETLEADLKAFGESRGITFDESVIDRKVNVNPKKSPVEDKSKLYTPEMRAAIEEVFKKDLELFNYSYEGFVGN